MVPHTHQRQTTHDMTKAAMIITNEDADADSSSAERSGSLMTTQPAAGAAVLYY